VVVSCELEVLAFFHPAMPLFAGLRCDVSDRQPVPEDSRHSRHASKETNVSPIIF
jgi:hypothetical protein